MLWSLCILHKWWPDKLRFGQHARSRVLIVDRSNSTNGLTLYTLSFTYATPCTRHAHDIPCTYCAPCVHHAPYITIRTMHYTYYYHHHHHDYYYSHHACTQHMVYPAHSSAIGSRAIPWKVRAMRRKRLRYTVIKTRVPSIMSRSYAAWSPITSLHRSYTRRAYAP